MTMPWRILKKWIIGALVILLAADIGLVYIRWQNTREGEASMIAERDRLALLAKSLKGDVARGERIRASMSGVTKEYDAFYRTDFESTTDGYSEIEADLDGIAAKASVKSSGVAFDQKEVKGRGVEEIKITDTVDGDYPAIIKFINGLEQSKYFYLLSDLKLDSAVNGNANAGNQGAIIRLHLELRTYFRS
jgi:Type II secretion system (T2SS), protein M subtype b